MAIASPTGGESSWSVAVTWAGPAPTAQRWYEVKQTGQTDAQAVAVRNGNSYEFTGLLLGKTQTLYVRSVATSSSSDSAARSSTTTTAYSEWLSVDVPQDPATLTLTVTPTQRHCLVRQQNLPLQWQVVGGVAPYTVTVGGAASSGGAHEVDCPTTAGTTTVPLVATDIQAPAASVTQNLTLIATPPLVVSAVANPTTCETDGQTQITWTVLGGADPHTVTVDGETVSTSPTTVDCGAVGSQMVVVAATDSSAPDQLSHRQEVELTVTSPAAPDPLALSASANPTTCETGDRVSISWSVSGGTSPYTVRVNGVLDSASPRTVTCQSTAGTQSVVVSATDAGSPQLSDSTVVSLTVTEPPPDPLDLFAWASPSSCQTGGSVSVYWYVSGGTTPYAVRVNGVLDSASPRTVTCQSTAGTQSIVVSATDAGSPQLSDSTVVSLTVTEPPPDPLDLFAWSSPSSCQTGGSVSVYWYVSGGTSPYTVRVNGALDSASQRTVTCQSTAGTQSVAVSATDAGSPRLSDQQTVSLTVSAPPLALSASVSPTTCDRGSSVTVSWSVSGGTTPYTVTVDGVPDSASPRSVDCTSNSNSQTFVVLASDSGAVEQTRTRTLTATVTTPDIMFEGRSRARICADGRAEFCFQLRNQTCILPATRYLTPANMVAGRWYHSSSVAGSVGGASRVLGKISVMKPSGASYIDVCFTPQGGSRACPTPNNFYWRTATVDSWRSAGWRDYTIDGDTADARGSLAQPEESSGSMDAAPEDESPVAGTDGGLMWSEDDAPSGG